MIKRWYPMKTVLAAENDISLTEEQPQTFLTLLVLGDDCVTITHHTQFRFEVILCALVALHHTFEVTDLIVVVSQRVAQLGLEVI